MTKNEAPATRTYSHEIDGHHIRMVTVERRDGETWTVRGVQNRRLTYPVAASNLVPQN